MVSAVAVVLLVAWAKLEAGTALVVVVGFWVVVAVGRVFGRGGEAPEPRPRAAAPSRTPSARRLGARVGTGRARIGAPLLPFPFAVVDTETTGLWNRTAREFRPGGTAVVSIGLLVFERDWTLRSRWSSLVHTDVPIEPEAYRKNRITKKMLVGAPSAEQVGAAIRDLTDGVDYWVAHNAEFDRRSIASLGVFTKEGQWLCTMKTLAPRMPGGKWPTLEEAAEVVGLDIPSVSSDRHDALVDAEWAADVFAGLARVSTIGTIAPDLGTDDCVLPPAGEWETRAFRLVAGPRHVEFIDAVCDTRQLTLNRSEARLMTDAMRAWLDTGKVPAPGSRSDLRFEPAASIRSTGEHALAVTDGSRSQIVLALSQVKIAVGFLGDTLSV